MTAKKTTPPRRRASTAAKVAPPEVADKTPAADLTAPTRTATAGAATRTAARPRARTAARADTVTVEPTDIVDGSPAADEAPADPADGGEQADVVWRGRTIRVQLPTLEQMTIYRRLSKKFAALADTANQPGAEPMTLEEATGHYDRAIKLVTSVMVNPADVEWLEDELLERRVTLPDAADLMKEAIGKLGEANTPEPANRQDRRAAGRKARLGD